MDFCALAGILALHTMNQIVFIVFELIVLLFSVILHEVSHGVIAYALGDTTAKDAHRLTLNPISHLDVMGSLVVPLSLFLLSGGSFVFGWAKPVPYNPYNLKNPKVGGGMIAAAGPITNFIIAFFASGCLFVVRAFGLSFVQPELLQLIIVINVALAVFNLVPIPPLDGSKVLAAFLPNRAAAALLSLERYGMVLLLLFIFFGFQLILPIIYWIARFLL
ncbi:MAG: site-2 protease family protein [Candidatus Paceibacterota bacterium]